jgi:predicted metalloprotease
MRWEGRRQSDNFEDRRGSGGGGFGRIPTGARIRLPRGGRAGGVTRAGGGSIILFAVVALALWAFAGINPLQLLDMLGGGSGGQVATAPQRTPEQQAGDDQRAQFMRVVLAETEDTWGRIFQANGATYSPPTLVAYSGFSESACGLSSAAVGPFYCPLDQRVYIDLSFFDTLETRFDAPGDFAQAYVLAHEVGHHVQNLTGVLRRSMEARQGMSEAAANIESIRVELQADCYAGVWAHAADRSGIVEEGDIDEALGAAAAVGDDLLQRRTQGYVVPESFNHGTSEQRSRWFRVGYASGDPGDCDTYDAEAL